MELISSRQNPVVKRFRQLADGDPSGQWMLLDGEHLVTEALASGIEIDVAAFAQDVVAGSGPSAGGDLTALAAGLERRGVRVIAVTAQVLAAASPVRHPSGTVAIARQPSATLEAIFHAQPPLVLILAGLQDPGNVGAIVRAAEGGGATGIVVTMGTADPFTWKALRGGMGSTFRLPIATKLSLENAVSRARAAGLRVIATTARNGTPLPACDLRAGCAILLGGEGAGLLHNAIEAADERLTIPMRVPVESLNVAVSAALILYEAARQRVPAAEPPGRSTHVAL
jgi:RNA methyltransferase, TrmH family